MEKAAIVHEDTGQEWVAERRHQAWEDRTIVQWQRTATQAQRSKSDSQCQSEKAGTTAYARTLSAGGGKTA